MSEVRRVAVIGAGAAGIMAGIAAARSGAEVSLLEHTDSIGSKLLMTGNGKCNYTNTDISRDSFHSGTDRDDRIGSIITRFGYAEAEAFFKSIGIIGRERRGCIYRYGGVCPDCIETGVEKARRRDRLRMQKHKDHL